MSTTMSSPAMRTTRPLRIAPCAKFAAESITALLAPSCAEKSFIAASISASNSVCADADIERAETFDH